jgi:hypothetical protein
LVAFCEGDILGGGGGEGGEGGGVGVCECFVEEREDVAAVDEGEESSVSC